MNTKPDENAEKRTGRPLAAVPPRFEFGEPAMPSPLDRGTRDLPQEKGKLLASGKRDKLPRCSAVSMDTSGRSAANARKQDF